MYKSRVVVIGRKCHIQSLFPNITLRLIAKSEKHESEESYFHPSQLYAEADSPIMALLPPPDCSTKN